MAGRPNAISGAAMSKRKRKQDDTRRDGKSAPKIRGAAPISGPYHFDAHNNLGIAYYAKGRFDDAIVQFKDALRIKPDDVGVREHIALMEEAKANALKSPNSSGPKR
jgi:tetratricopeptide (TPR) repeat protein